MHRGLGHLQPVESQHQRLVQCRIACRHLPLRYRALRGRVPGPFWSA